MKTKFLNCDGVVREVIWEIDESIIMYKRASIVIKGELWFARTPGTILIDENVIINKMTQNYFSIIDD